MKLGRQCAPLNSSPALLRCYFRLITMPFMAARSAFNSSWPAGKLFASQQEGGDVGRRPRVEAADLAILRRHAVTDAIGQIADAPLVPPVQELGPCERRRLIAAAQIGLVAFLAHPCVLLA